MIFHRYLLVSTLQSIKLIEILKIKAILISFKVIPMKLSDKRQKLTKESLTFFIKLDKFLVFIKVCVIFEFFNKCFVADNILNYYFIHFKLIKLIKFTFLTLKKYKFSLFAALRIIEKRFRADVRKNMT